MQLTQNQRLRAITLKRLKTRLLGFAVASVLASLLSCGGSTETTPDLTSDTDVVIQNPTDNALPVQPTGDQATPAQTNPEQDAQQVPPATVVADDHTEHSIRFTDSNADIWPPQPIDITEVSVLGAATKNTDDTDKTATTRLAAIRKAIAVDSNIQKVLGTRYEILAQNDIAYKSNAATRVAIEAFNYNTNQVITVELDSKRSSVISHSAKSAQLYQPPETQLEVKRAIELAALALSNQGFTDHSNLAGTGLLAFPTAAQSAETGFDFFRDRKIYVTFGTGNGELPDYRALVNLSSDTVESSGAIQ